MTTMINGRTPERIKQKLEKCPNADCSLCLSSFHCALEADALTYIQWLEAAQPKWISVEERLPEICDMVLVSASGKPKENIELINATLIASFWGDEGWIADGFDGWDKLKVTHWMPLPEPPKEVET